MLQGTCPRLPRKVFIQKGRAKVPCIETRTRMISRVVGCRRPWAPPLVDVHPWHEICVVVTQARTNDYVEHRCFVRWAVGTRHHQKLLHQSDFILDHGHHKGTDPCRRALVRSGHGEKHSGTPYSPCCCCCWRCPAANRSPKEYHALLTCFAVGNQSWRHHLPFIFPHCGGCDSAQFFAEGQPRGCWRQRRDWSIDGWLENTGLCKDRDACMSVQQKSSLP